MTSLRIESDEGGPGPSPRLQVRMNRCSSGPAAPPASSRSEVWAAPARPELIPELRRRVCQFAATMGFDGDALDDIRLAVGEALANALRHGCRGDPRCEIRVRAEVHPDRLVVEVEDPGGGFDPEGASPRSANSTDPGGFGVHFMRSVMDGVTFAIRPDATVVRLEKALPSAKASRSE